MGKEQKPPAGSGDSPSSLFTMLFAIVDRDRSLRWVFGVAALLILLGIAKSLDLIHPWAFWAGLVILFSRVILHILPKAGKSTSTQQADRLVSSFVTLCNAAMAIGLVYVSALLVLGIWKTVRTQHPILISGSITVESQPARDAAQMEVVCKTDAGAVLLAHVDANGSFSALAPAGTTSVAVTAKFGSLEGSTVFDLKHNQFTKVIDLEPASVEDEQSLINQYGLTWNSVSQSISAEGAGTAKLQNFALLIDAFEKLKPCQLDLQHCDALGNVDGLKSVITLTNVSFVGCDALTNIEGLQGMKNLRGIKLDGCSAVDKIHCFRGLSSLNLFAAMNCYGLTNIGDLQYATNIVEVDLHGSPNLQCGDTFSNLPSLMILKLGHNKMITNLNSFYDLPSLEILDLTGAPNLTNVDSLRRLTGLQVLGLDSCTAFNDEAGLEKLTELQKLDLINCKALPKATWKRILTALPYTRIRTPDGLDHLPETASRK